MQNTEPVVDDTESIRPAAMVDIAASLADLPQRAIVAVDGVDGAGKTTFADRLKPLIEGLGRQAVRASVDGFHNQAGVRYSRGKSSPLGYFLDSYNYDAFRRFLVEPFRRGEDVVETARFDHKVDLPLIRRESVGPSAILIIDGIFLHRDELWTLWDYSIFLSVPFALAYKRMALRDGCDPNPEAASNHRYYAGQLIYLDTCRPQERAALVIKG
jgi:uridine kinase